MTKITVMNPEKIRLLQEAIKASFSAIEKEFGVSCKFGNSGYTQDSVTLKLEISVIGADGIALDKEAQTFKEYAKLIGFEPTDLGCEINVNGKTYIIDGYLTTRRKYPIRLREKNGGPAVCATVESVQKALLFQRTLKK